MTGSEPYRVAVYYAPERDDPLWAAGVGWLGRDPETGENRPVPEVVPRANVLQEAANYGFHGTLKPPMQLAKGMHYADFRAAVIALAAGLTPFELPALAVHDLHGFLALRESTPCIPLQAMADIAVAELDAFRAPASPDELARRRRGGLSAAQDAMLLRWGYPYVFQQWRFHLTLTRRLDEEEMRRLKPAAEAWFAAALALPRRVESLAIYVQASPGGAFTLASRHAIGC